MRNIRQFIFFIVIGLAIGLNVKIVFATGGGLRKNSIKTCPNGVTYGKHSDGHGGLHWHVALTNGDNYYASGDAIYEDPCPESNKNEGTAGHTNGSSNNNSSGGTTNQNGIIANSGTSNNEVKKSNDTSIEYILINEHKIYNISDEIDYTIDKKHAKIEIKTKNSNASYEINGNTENLDANNINKIEIIVTAEDGTKKTYILNITRNIIESKVEIREFIVNDDTIKFENKKGSTFFLYSTKEFKYSYKLTDNDSSLTILAKDGEEIRDETIKLNQGHNYYTLLITDSNGNNNSYELDIERVSQGGSILLILISLTLFVALPVGIIAFFVIRKKKKNS